MIKQLSSIVLGICVLFAASNATAGILSISSASGEPGQTVTVMVDVSSVNGADYSSIDTAVQVTPMMGTGASPTLSSMTPGAIWTPYGGNITTVFAPALGAGVTSSVIGISGNVVGQTINSDGGVLSLDITIPGSATVGDVFNLDLVEDFSNITDSTVNPSVALPSMTFGDGKLTIIPEPSGLLAGLLGVFGMGYFRRKYQTT